MDVRLHMIMINGRRVPLPSRSYLTIVSFGVATYMYMYLHLSTCIPDTSCVRNACIIERMYAARSILIG